MKELNKFQIDESATLKDAMEAITANGRGVIFIRTQDEKIIGILTDGDIRRALLEGTTFMAPVSTIMSPKMIFSDTSDKKTIKQIMLEKKVSMVPVLSKEKHLIDLIFIDELQDNI